MTLTSESTTTRAIAPLRGTVLLSGAGRWSSLRAAEKWPRLCTPERLPRGGSSATCTGG